MPRSGARRRLVVEADGGSRGNPGVAGYGALVRDADTGMLLAERAAPLGLRSNNVAEYRALIAGLEAARRVDPGADVEVRMDSRLVIEQMAGRWKVKHEDMRRLALQARDLVRQIQAAGGDVAWTWIPREQNRAADRLSNAGMDGRTVDRLLEQPGTDLRDEPGTAGSAAARVVAGGGSAGPSGLVRLLLLQDAGTGAAEAAARAVRELVAGYAAQVVTSSEPAAVQTGAVVAAALGTEPRLDPGWDPRALAGARGPAADAGRRLATVLARAGPQGTTLVVVTSRASILLVLSTLLDIPPERVGALATDPGSLTAVELLPDGQVSVPFTNRTAHLRPGTL